MRHDARPKSDQDDALATLWHETAELVAPPARFAAGTREIEKLQRDDVDGMRDDQIAQIVHDLKGPLSTMSLESCLLEEKLAGPDHGEERAIVARIQHNVRYLDRLTHDILDACLIDAGRLELRRAPIEMRAFLEDVIDRAVPTRYRPHVFLEAPDRITIGIDDLRIERVVANLLTNALKYAPACSGIVVRLAAHDNGVTVSVIDAGTSLGSSEGAGVFAKYTRGSTSTSREGCGLGLYICRQIVEAHGGRIDVERVSGIGTRFYFDLPW